MRRIIIPIIIFILAQGFSLSARADFRETDDSYYSRLEKSCEYTVRESWRDYLLYAPHKKTDACCADSVAAMKAAGAREAQNGTCPAGMVKNMMKCQTTKIWCEKAR